MHDAPLRNRSRPDLLGKEKCAARSRAGDQSPAARRGTPNSPRRPVPAVTPGHEATSSVICWPAGLVAAVVVIVSVLRLQVQVNLKSNPRRALLTAMTDLLTIGEVARRSGVASSALRFYEERGLIASERAGSGHRRYRRPVLRRIAFIVFAQRVGLTLNEIGAELRSCRPTARPTRRDWSRLSSKWAGASTSASRSSSGSRPGSPSASGAAASRSTVAAWPTRAIAPPASARGRATGSATAGPNEGWWQTASTLLPSGSSSKGAVVVGVVQLAGPARRRSRRLRSRRRGTHRRFPDSRP